MLSIGLYKSCLTIVLIRKLELGYTTYITLRLECCLNNCYFKNIRENEDGWKCISRFKEIL